MGRGFLSPRPLHSRSASTNKPNPNCYDLRCQPRGGPLPVSSLGQMVFSVARTCPINSPGPLTPQFIPSSITQKGILQHQPQMAGGRVVSARQRTVHLPAPQCRGFPTVALAAAAAAATAALAFRASLGLSTWSSEQLRASFR
jgi:hypothetical protein